MKIIKKSEGIAPGRKGDLFYIKIDVYFSVREAQ